MVVEKDRENHALILMKRRLSFPEGFFLSATKCFSEQKRFDIF